MNSYDETLPLLYAENTFVVGDWNLQSTPSHLWRFGRFELVRSVRMSFHFRAPPPVTKAEKARARKFREMRCTRFVRYRDSWPGWYEHWHVLSTLLNLRDLVVSLHIGYGPEEFSLREDLILEPAMKVRGLTSFAIVVPWPEGKGRIAREEGLPFRLVRVEHALFDWP